MVRNDEGFTPSGLDKKWMKAKSGFHLVLRITISAVLISAAISKLIAPDNYLASLNLLLAIPIVNQFKFQNLEIFSLYFISTTELIFGIAILFRSFDGVSKIVITSLFIFFIIWNGINIVSGTTADCGCFGNAIELDHARTLVLDTLLLLSTITVYSNNKNYKTNDILVSKN